MEVDYRGKLLAAHPSNPKDGDQMSALLIITHNKGLSLGLRINQIIPNHDLSAVCQNLGIWYEGSEPIFYGGKSGQNRIHVIHSLEWVGPSTMILNKDIGVTNDVSVLAAISDGEGPEYFRACAGHRIWNHQLLEKQIDPKNYPSDEVHRWEIANATIDNIFNEYEDDQWRKILEDSAKQQAAAWF
jgi:putative AlgH/UPF0301 family transcriptional regulator